MRLCVLRALTIVTLFGVTLIEANSSRALARPTAPCDDEALFTLVLSRPGDAVANIEFARQAEACGDLRHAFAALERAVLSSPGDTEAQMEFERVRNKLRPDVTTVTVVAGGSYSSNPLQLANSAQVIDQNTVPAPTNFGPPFAVRRPDAFSYDFKIAVADDRTIGSLRWRTLARAQGQFFQPDDITGGEVNLSRADPATLNSPILSVESGPVLPLTPDLWMHIAGGAAIVWLDNERHHVYDDASVSVTLGGLYKGLPQTMTAAYTWRDGNFADFGANDAQIFDLEGSLTFSPSLLAKADVLNLLPSLQVSQADDGIRAALLGPEDVVGPGPALFPAPLFVRPLFPGDFTEVGGGIYYYFPLFRGAVFLGAGVRIYRRWYDEFAGGAFENPHFCDCQPRPLDRTKRRDTYFESNAHLIFPSLLRPNVDLRFDYRYEHNDSNARIATSALGERFSPLPGVIPGGAFVETPADFENHVAGVHIVGRF